jgi:hypothetical protein
MTSDYEQITRENKRKFGEETVHLQIYKKLYADRTHFIYELLQNAEDAGATKIHFDLFSDRIEIIHDGRLFSETDVASICSVGRSSKADDATKIGKFGIGFKSVYAYTLSPQIHSGDEHFRIDSFVRPAGIDAEPIAPGFTTRFVLPFDAEWDDRDRIINSVSLPVAEIAVTDLTRLLKSFSARNLLFLRSLTSLSYRLPDGDQRTFTSARSDDVATQRVTLRQHEDREDQPAQSATEHWLVYAQPVHFADTADIDTNTPSLQVEIAFQFRSDDSGAPLAIEAVPNSNLFVFFETAKQTQLRFLVQGPFRTTPARDNIRENDAVNQHLIKVLADLTKKALIDLRDRGLISVQLLEMLPIRKSDFPAHHTFRPIYDAVHQVLKNEQVLPGVRPGQYISAGRAYLAGSTELIRIFPQNILSQLLGRDNVAWLSTRITDNRTPDLFRYFKEELCIAVYDRAYLAARINVYFLSRQTTAWMIRFYQWLHSHSVLWNVREEYSKSKTRIVPGILRNKPIIRLSDGTQVVPFDSDGKQPAVFLPNGHTGTYPTVHEELASDAGALKFLQALGISHVGLTDDVYHSILPKYIAPAKSPVSEEEYRSDLHKIITALTGTTEKNHTSLVQRAAESAWVRAMNKAGESSFQRPGEVYSRNPLLDTYFQCPTIWFVDPTIEAKISSVKKHPFLPELPRRIAIKSANDPEWPERPLKYSTKGHDFTNYELDGLQAFLDTLPTIPDSRNRIEQAAMLWYFLIESFKRDAAFFSATYIMFYQREQKQMYDARFLKTLRSSAWIPDLSGRLHRPTEIRSDQITAAFDCSATCVPDVLNLLGIVRGSELTHDEMLERVAAAEGLDPDKLKAALKDPRKRAKFNSLLEEDDDADFPEKPVPDKPRRRKGMRSRTAKAKSRSHSKRPRSVRSDSNVVDQDRYLYENYTNDHGQLICQMCEEEMPFRKRDGSYYFEARQLLSVLPELEANYVALCPVCAARFGEFVQRDPAARQQIAENLPTAIDRIPLPTVPDMPGGAALRFTEQHLFDLQTIAETIHDTSNAGPAVD